MCSYKIYEIDNNALLQTATINSWPNVLDLYRQAGGYCTQRSFNFYDNESGYYVLVSRPFGDGNKLHIAIPDKYAANQLKDKIGDSPRYTYVKDALTQLERVVNAQGI